ncbi:MAG: competence protein ComEC [Acidobacteriota bacterium]|jgi:competence protein ComEC|nr:competence protein ComEC [Acidobacteriota bacterium]
MRAADSQQPTFLPHPLAVLAAAFALGVLAARFILLPLSLVLACAAACSLAVVYSYVRAFALPASVMLALAFFCAGATLMVLEKSSVARERVERLYDGGLIASGDPVEVTGVVMGAPEPAPDGFYLMLNAEKLRFKTDERAVSGEILLFAPVRDAAARAEYEALELRYGARLSVMTALGRTDNFRNPGVSTLTEYLERRRVDATGLIKSPLLVERLDDVRVFLPLAWIYEWRQHLLAEIDGKFSVETGGVLKAALLGNRYALSLSAAERFREGGTFHVLVISGLHISFIGGIVLFLMRRVTKRRVWQFCVSVAFLWAYTIAVGAEVSVVRAALMFTVVTLAPVLHRRARSLNALGGATLLLLVWRPSDLFDPSFQLTFLSVLAIIVLAWPLLERLRNVGQWHPTRETPRPPVCAHWLRVFSETLFWSEREWQREMRRSNYSYRLFKTQRAARLEKLHLQRALRYAFGAIVVSASVQIVLLPLLVIYFHRFSMAALVLNIWVGALMALLALTTLSAILIFQLSAWAAAPLFKLAEGLNWLMVHGVDPFAAAGYASVRIPEYAGWPFILYLLYYIPLLALAHALARWNPFAHATEDVKQNRFRLLFKPRSAAAALATMFILIVAHPFSAGRPDGRLRIDFLDVGQGDAALITMPDGTTLLVDAGGRPQFRAVLRSAGEDEATETFERDTRSIGERVVSEYLWWRGLDRVDYILATHADADHIDGLKDVARNFHVRAAIVGRAPGSDSEFAQFAATAEKYNVPVRLVGRGDILRFGAVEALVLWPTRTEDLNAPSRNNDSIVLRLRFGNRIFLLTGDIEKDAEAALTSAPEDELHCDVVKVAHHGSRTSSIDAFVKATKPAYAIISVGLTSIFGHPHREVLERWRTSGAEILTTGQRGTITFSTNGNELRVETFVKQ